MSDYSLDGKKEWKDDNGTVHGRYLPFCLRYTLAQCHDFRNELTAMEDLARRLSIQSSAVNIIYTPKYHCEIAGEGIEYSWDIFKKFYRKLLLSENKGVSNFRSSVRKSVEHVNIQHVRKFTARARRYMLAYMHFDDSNIPAKVTSYDQIERFVKKESKAHRNVLDNDTGFLNSVWKQSMLL